MFGSFSKKAQQLHAYLKLLAVVIRRFVKCSYRFIIFHSNPFLIQLFYFISISFAGFLALKILEPGNEVNRLKNLDLFFTSVSASTVSSMGTVEMEVFSDSQLWVLILLMLVGGEVFTSMLGLQFMKARFKSEGPTKKRAESLSTDLEVPICTNLDDESQLKCTILAGTLSKMHLPEGEHLKHDAIQYLGYVVLCYLIVATLSGSSFILLYLSFVSNARDVLESKGIRISTFSFFTAVSSLGNCGFTPANENMMIFKKNSILLLLIVPQVLAGNTLFPVFLRFMIWVVKKLTKREELNYMIQHPRATRYKHLLPPEHSGYLAFTVLGFILVQMVLFCSLEWNSEALQGLNSFQKLVGALFQSVNSRHAGESIIDLSKLSPAILVLYVVMMYLPPYTSFLPIKDVEWRSVDEKEGNERGKLLKSLIFSQLSYLVIFITLICITERKAMIEDPLNFNVFNIVFEVISAYGNVGFSIGYSCQRLLKPNNSCKDAWYGFVGRWSNQGKLILLFVMLFGRLKKFNMEGGKAWKLS
ncbi:probable cation transporter HKT6 [Phoenix dactylifera]|uniref:Probable cation transporter HKT6 n=1 Tax=Phoenix dactylifera TaxID=42345 RepID=A0A8B7BN27_PHODC|nr:probable cation transporter HKT6 [Phoenix dactylifera]